jgi:hypothetical protein
MMMHQPNRFCPPINIYASAQYIDDTDVDVLFQVVTTAKTGPLIPRLAYADVVSFMLNASTI